MTSPAQARDGSGTQNPHLEIKRLCSAYLAGRANGTIPPPVKGEFVRLYFANRQAARDRVLARIQSQKDAA